MTKFIKTIFTFTFLLAISPLYSQSKQDYIRELFVVMKQDSIMEQIGKVMVQNMMMQQQMVKKANPEMIHKSTERLDQLFDANEMVAKQMVMMKRFVKEDMVDIYDKHFTIEEIKDYITFYKSPSGQKFRNESPKIQNDVMMIMMQKYFPEMQKEFEKKLDKHMEELKKESKLD